MNFVTPPSRSAYRGQSRIGVGEGPDQTILHGEQYIRVDAELYESELLDAMRPWMTLDSDPADHQRLRDQLESWSVFSVRDYLVVVRLVSAGYYDQRAAYFSHARAWKRSALPRAFDPGLNLGCESAFANPWRDHDLGPSENLETNASLVRPQQVKQEADTAALFLGHLFQAMVQQSALIITAPVADFTSGGALHALVSFARAGLPAELRDDCRVRVYSRMPMQFLRQLRAHLTVVPQPAATEAVAARPTATLLDRYGNAQMGKDLDPRYHDYARWVVERAVAMPDRLAHFSDRYAFRPHELGRGESARASVQITYNIAFALSGNDEGRAALLTEYLPWAASTFGPGLDWKRLLREDDWNDLPRKLLLDRLLVDREALSDGERELLQTMEASASRLALLVDERLDSWWSATDPAKLRRLVELLTHAPPLVSEAAAAERTVGIPLDRIAPYGALHHVLRAEARTEWIRERKQAAELAAYANQPEVFAVLREAVVAGRLDTGWAQIFVKRALAEEIIAAARLWLSDQDFWRRWDVVPRLLLDRLRSLQPAPVSLRPIIAATPGLDAVADLRVYVRIADLLTRIDEAEGRGPDTALLEPLLRRSGELVEDDRGFVESVAFDREWRCLRLETMRLSDLLQLALLFRKEESFVRLYAEIDERLLRQPEATTAALVSSGWWSFWRSRSRLNRGKREEAEALQRGALEWLRSSRIDVSLEAWRLAVADLPRRLTGADLARLREQSSDGAAWPLIPPFEQRQVDDLAGRAADLGALAEIAEAVTVDGFPRPVHEYVLSRSPFAAELPAEALGWLIITPARNAGALSPLTLQESALLFERAGHRMAQALEARIRSVVEALRENALEALRAAARPNLWRNGRFLAGLAQWICDQPGAAAIGRDALTLIEKQVDGSAEPRPAARPELVQALVRQGWHRTADLLDADTAKKIQRDVLSQNVVDALLQKRANDPCWQKLAESVRKVQSGKALSPQQHPLRLVAELITSSELSLDQRKTLRMDGWSTFEKVARQQKVLIAPPPAEHSGLPLFDFAATMLGPGAIGLAAMRIRELVEPAWREDAGWWRRLLVSLRGFRRYGGARCGDDRESLALTYILDSLTPTPDEHRALTAAMSFEARTNANRAPLAELGMETL